MHLKSPLLEKIPGIVHGFGTRDEPIAGPFQKRWSELKPKWSQAHATDVVEVRQAGQECGAVDALFTAHPGQPIGVFTADCVPVLLARREGGRVAAVHAGWRGTRARILRALWEKLGSQGESPQDWVAAIGPSIGPCCYEVSEELARDFEREFAPFGEGLAVPSYRHLDLPAINEQELKSIGVIEVDLLRACTMCSGSPGEWTYHSYRRDGGGTRQYSLITLAEAT